MRNARAHKLQWSDPTVHSSTVTTCKLQPQIVINIIKYPLIVSKILDRIFFPQLVSAGIFFIQNCLAGILLSKSPTSHQKLNGRPLT